MAYCIVDLETSVKNKGEESVGNMSASPFHPDNDIVLAGTKMREQSRVIITDGEYLKVPSIRKEIDLLVGHNITFDILYLLRYPAFKEWIKKGHIWDTMIVEYLLSGQIDSFPSLDKCSLKRGLPVKDSKIKDYWDSGMDTEDIPREELEEYLKQDVLNTEEIFLSQLQEADEKGMLPLIKTAMEFRLATIEMEYNGMMFNKEQCKHETFTLVVKKQHILDTHILPFMRKRLGHNISLNPNSNDQISLAIFGGEYTYKTPEPVLDEDGCPILYKTGTKIGQPRTKLIEKKQRVSTSPFLNTFQKPTKKKGIYQTGDDVLKQLLANALLSTGTKEYIEAILKHREIEKDIGTYYEGYSSLVWHGGLIHPSYNHAVTRTGRVSCSNPNLQQVSNKDG